MSQATSGSCSVRVVCEDCGSARLVDEGEGPEQIVEEHQAFGCWCQRLNDDGPACHGEVIAEWADRLGRDETSVISDPAQRDLEGEPTGQATFNVEEDDV
jgi:hypothetical protein